MKIKDRVFELGVYDKTEKFKFNVIKYPSIKSNVPDSILYSVFYSQTLRIMSFCNTKSTLKEWFRKIVSRCRERGATQSKLIRKLRKVDLASLKNRIDITYNELCELIF